MADTAPTTLTERSTESRVIRIFLSSTFRDFMEERDLLVKKVFPELRRKARERGVEVVDVDLRWGITEEESRLLRIVGIRSHHYHTNDTDHGFPVQLTPAITCAQELSCKPIRLVHSSYGSGWVYRVVRRSPEEPPSLIGFSS